MLCARTLCNFGQYFVQHFVHWPEFRNRRHVFAEVINLAEQTAHL